MEENINEVLGIETAQTNGSVVENTEPEINNTSSKGLSNAAYVCNIILWLCVAMAFISAFAYLIIGGDMDSFSEYKRISAAQNRAIAGTCFIYGIVGAISCFISCKFLYGIEVIAKAAELYLSKEKGTDKNQQLAKGKALQKSSEIDLSSNPIALYKSKSESFEVRVINDDGYGVYECVTLDGLHTYHFKREFLEFKVNK